MPNGPVGTPLDLPPGSPQVSLQGHFFFRTSHASHVLYAYQILTAWPPSRPQIMPEAMQITNAASRLISTT